MYYHNDCYIIKNTMEDNKIIIRLFSQLMLLSLFFAVTIDAQDSEQALRYSLRSVYELGHPIIIKKQKKILYNLVLVFDRIPRNYWVHYDKTSSHVIVECYGASLEGAPNIRLSGKSIFKSVETRVASTALALPSKRSDIIITMVPDTAWHVKETKKGNNTIILTLWKDFKITAVDLKKPKKKIWIELTIGLVITLLTAGMILLFIKD